jgi:hypothetical protein
MLFVQIFEAAGKKKKNIAFAETRELCPLLSANGGNTLVLDTSSPRAKSMALSKGAFFTES